MLLSLETRIQNVSGGVSCKFNNSNIKTNDSVKCISNNFSTSINRLLETNAGILAKNLAKVKC